MTYNKKNSKPRNIRNIRKTQQSKESLKDTHIAYLRQNKFLSRRLIHLLYKNIRSCDQIQVQYIFIAKGKHYSIAIELI